TTADSSSTAAVSSPPPRSAASTPPTPTGYGGALPPRRPPMPAPPGRAAPPAAPAPGRRPPPRAGWPAEARTRASPPAPVVHHAEHVSEGVDHGSSHGPLVAARRASQKAYWCLLSFFPCRTAFGNRQHPATAPWVGGGNAGCVGPCRAGSLAAGSGQAAPP